MIVFPIILCACAAIYIAGIAFSFFGMWYIDATGTPKSERIHLVMIFLTSTCWPWLVWIFLRIMRTSRQESLAQPDDRLPAYAPPPP